MHGGLALYLALRQADDRYESRHCCSDDLMLRRNGIRIDAREPALRRRVAKLRTALPAAISVFRELLRRPAGGTVVVLVPRTKMPDASDTVVVDDEWMSEAG